MKRYWYKTYVSVTLSRERMQMQHWLFHRLMEFEAIAADYGKDGLLPPVKDMAWILRPVEEKKLTEDLQALSEIGELTVTPEGWQLVQFKERQESDSTERVRKFREKNKDVTDVTPVTDGNDENVTLLSFLKSNSFLSLERGGVGEKTKYPELDLFYGYFGKFLSEKEIKRWQVVYELIGKDHAEEITEWAFKKEIHLDNRGGLLDSLETAAKKWQDKGNGQKQTTEPAMPKGVNVSASWLKKKQQELAHGNTH